MKRCEECDRRETREFTFGDGQVAIYDWCLEFDDHCKDAIRKCKALVNG